MLRDYHFVEDGHKHMMGDVQIPGVTGILVDEGYVDIQWFTEWARERGRIVHKATHLLDMGVLDWDTIDERIEGYLRAYEAFKRDIPVEILISERPMCSFIHRFGTIPDRVVRLNGKVADIDFKTGPIAAWVGLQTAAHDIAIQECCPEFRGVHIERYGLELRSTGKYRLVPFKDRQDRYIFLAGLAGHNWKLNHRR